MKVRIVRKRWQYHISEQFLLRLRDGLDQRLHLGHIRAARCWCRHILLCGRGALIPFCSDRWRHHGFHYRRVAADRTGDQAARLLRLIITAGTEPGFEHMALITAFKVEHDHEIATS